MAELNRKCDYCGHSRAAHADGVACALCRCRSERREFVQQPLAFRQTLPLRATRNARKR
jgi:hypothetical protein